MTIRRPTPPLRLPNTARMDLTTAELRHLATLARRHRCGRPGDLRDLARASACLLRAATLAHRSRAMTTIAIECITHATGRRPEEAPPSPPAPRPAPDPTTEPRTPGWLILQPQTLADGSTERALFGAAANPRKAYLDARRRCEAIGCTLPADARAMPCGHTDLNAATAALEAPRAVERLSREPVITAGRTSFLRGAPCQDCAGLNIPDCPHCGGTGFENADVDPVPDNDVALPVATRWAPRPDDPLHHAHGHPVYPPCPDCNGDIEWTERDPRVRRCWQCGALYSTTPERP